MKLSSFEHSVISQLQLISSAVAVLADTVKSGTTDPAVRSQAESIAAQVSEGLIQINRQAQLSTLLGHGFNAVTVYRVAGVDVDKLEGAACREFSKGGAEPRKYLQMLYKRYRWLEPRHIRSKYPYPIGTGHYEIAPDTAHLPDATRRVETLVDYDNVFEGLVRMRTGNYSGDVYDVAVQFKVDGPNKSVCQLRLTNRTYSGAATPPSLQLMTFVPFEGTWIHHDFAAFIGHDYMVAKVEHILDEVGYGPLHDPSWKELYAMIQPLAEVLGQDAVKKNEWSRPEAEYYTVDGNLELHREFKLAFTRNMANKPSIWQLDMLFDPRQRWGYKFHYRADGGGSLQWFDEHSRNDTVGYWDQLPVLTKQWLMRHLREQLTLIQKDSISNQQAKKEHGETVDA